MEEASKSTSENTQPHLVGCCELPDGMSRARYFEKLPLLEIAALASKAGTPNRKTVRTWREKSPESAHYSLLAHHQLTHGKPFQSGDANERVVAELADYCEILRAQAVVFCIPNDFSPSASHRDELRDFFENLATPERFGNTRRVVQGGGLWEPETVATLAESLDLLVAVDPLASDPFGDTRPFVEREIARGEAYFRVSGIGHTRRRYESYDLEVFSELTQELSRSWTLLGHTGKYPDALKVSRDLGLSPSESA